MVTADRQIHKKPPIASGLKTLPTGTARTETKNLKFDCRKTHYAPEPWEMQRLFVKAL
jgi:hypothetical protein